MARKERAMRRSFIMWWAARERVAVPGGGWLRGLLLGRLTQKSCQASKVLLDPYWWKPSTNS